MSDGDIWREQVRRFCRWMGERERAHPFVFIGLDFRAIGMPTPRQVLVTSRSAANENRVWP